MICDMRQRMDLDLELATLTLAEHRARWLTDQCFVSPVAHTADRLGVQVAHAGWSVRLVVELEHTGWAHLHFLTDTEGVQERWRVRSLARWDALLDQTVARASRLRLVHAQLVARTCTTGWLDWIHGELWLLPTSLVRVRSGLLDSVANSFGSGLTARNPGRPITYDPMAVLAGHRTNRIIPFDGIESARLHGGLSTSGLTVAMTDGTRHKLLWMSSEPARRLLTDRLLPVLGARLTV
jgi:hypothetical protein